jgi:hypothetical protein
VLALLQHPSSQTHDVAIFLLACLGDREAVPHLLALVGDQTVDDDLKLKIISLIQQLDPSVQAATLMGHLADAYGAFQRSQRDHLRQLKSPVDLALWVETMEAQMTPRARANFCRASFELDNPMAVPLLICMCYDPESDVALAAIDAVERFKDARALPALEELALYHPDPAVRVEARKAADRLAIRASLVEQVNPPLLAPLHGCYLTTVSGAGEQAVLVIRQPPDDRLELVQVVFNDQEGIRDCSGSLLSPDELTDVLGTLADQGVTPIRVSHGRCLAALDFAKGVTWKAGRPLPGTYVAWRQVIEGDGRPEAETPAQMIPLETRQRLLDSCHGLLLQDEFAQWCLGPDVLGDLYDRFVDLVAKGPARPAALRCLMREGVRETITDRMRRLIRERLLRMAPLLRDLYHEQETWQWAVVAAGALADDSPVPLDEHPLLLGMVACGLENLAGESIGWLKALAPGDGGEILTASCSGNGRGDA